MQKILFVISLMVLLFVPRFIAEATLPTLPESGTCENPKDFCTKHLASDLAWYTRNPHPMGSAAQERIAKILVERGQALNFRSFIHTFPAKTPNQGILVGRNVIWVKPGPAPCSLLFVSHYDTKVGTSYNLRLVGANDGGSSTILLLELGRVLSRLDAQAFEKNSWGACQLVFLWTDGEESTLWDWNTGQIRYGLQDNLYGSRSFAQEFLKQKNSQTRTWFFEGQPLVLTVVLDMVGHKKQVLDLTKGSDAFAAKQFQRIAVEKNLKIHQDRLAMEDDHKPFLERGIPVLHLIDWTNVKEWHTEKDDLAMVDVEKIKTLGECLLKFLNFDRR